VVFDGSFRKYFISPLIKSTSFDLTAVLISAPAIPFPYLGERYRMKSLKIYVAGPYSGISEDEIEKNVQRAVDAGLVIWKKGHFPYIPHLTHWPDIRAKETGVSMDWIDYMKWHAVWVDLCDALYLLGKSKGALLEYEHAKRTGKLVFHSIEEIPNVIRSVTWADSHGKVSE